MDRNLRKAAILLASIPESDSAALVSRLNADEIEAISAATASLDRVQEESQREIAADLIDARYQRSSSQTGSKANDTAENCRRWNVQAQRALEQLQDAPAEWLARALSRELPQTAAVILCHIHPKLAAEVLEYLTTETQLRVVHRIAKYEPIEREIVEEMVARVTGRYRLDRLQGVSGSGGLPFVAQIVARLDHATERALMENLAQDNREMVDQLLRMLALLKDRQRVCSASIVGPQNRAA